MLRKATEADLDKLIAFRQETNGGSHSEVAGWLENIVGLDNVLLVEQDTPDGPVLVSMVCAVPVETRGRHGIWFCGMATAPAFRGRGLMTKLMDGCLRAFATDGAEFAVVVPGNARTAQQLRGLQFQNAFALRFLNRTIPHNLWAHADFDAMTVRRLVDTRIYYQPGCINLPLSSMNEVVSQLYRRGGHDRFQPAGIRNLFCPERYPAVCGTAGGQRPFCGHPAAGGPGTDRLRTGPDHPVRKPVAVSRGGKTLQLRDDPFPAKTLPADRCVLPPAGLRQTNKES